MLNRLGSLKFFLSVIHEGNLNQYTLMPTHIISMFSVEELSGATMVDGFGFTRGAPVMKVPVIPASPFYTRHGPGVLIDCGTRLFDLETDPNQTSPIAAPDIEERMIRKMVELMIANEAPKELFARFGFPEFTEPRIAS